ncbi:MAG: hypothetical protein ACOCXI_02450 [Chloroflexota bacterium]
MSGRLATDEQRALLQRFEPILRFTRGEKFFPMRVGPYLSNSSLWQQGPDREPELLVPEGELNRETLAEARLAAFGTVHYLRFITPLNLSELASYRLHRLQEGLSRREPREVFRAGRGRLARVGYGSRFVDGLFQLSLLARGRVPGDTAAAAALAYRRIMEQDPHYSYYGRVTRQNGWLALQYWFFYPFNNWRSGFFGANDHEADWEMISVYCSERDKGEVCPEWVAYAAHDLAGDDLRRRWDDPEVEKVGEHPVVYAGAGSHACYFQAGDYLTELELPFLMPMVVLADRVEEYWQRLLRRYQYHDEVLADEPERRFNFFRVPFVDYARGDGAAIGPGQKWEWEPPQLLNPVPGWALHYRGLWGLFARDPFSGEDAPAGPVYNRDGTVRRAWYDPLGWAGLDKVPPPDEALAYVLEERAEVEARRSELADSIEEQSEALAALGVRARAMQNRPHLETTYTAHQEQIEALSRELDEMKAEFAADEALLEALDLHAEQLRAGLRGPMRAHIRRGKRPESRMSLRFGRFAEIWAAVSISALLIAFVVLFLLAPQFLGWGLVALISVFIFIEAGFRRQLPRFVNSVSIGLATVASLVLLYEFFWSIVVIIVVAAGAYLMWENLRELWS